MGTKLSAAIKTATIQDAKEWQSETDQYVFCIDWLAAHNFRGNDVQVDTLEERFEELLTREES